MNFAVDRPGARARAGAGSPLVGTPTDQYLPPRMPGFAGRALYPLDRPDVARARSLAAGHTRSGKAVLYTIDNACPAGGGPDREAEPEEDRARVAIKGLPPSAFFRQISAPDTPFDIAFIDWAPDYLDPFQLRNALFDGGFIGSTNWARLDAPEYNSS